ncbi:MAG: DUF1428 domain-containing protein [Pseudorhizobium sp.]
MTCITGFIGAVPTDNHDAFIRHAELSANGFKDHGLESAVECWGDDVPEGELTSLRRAVLAEPEETIIFSWYRWPSKEAQDDGLRAAMADPRLSPDQNPMPFDGKRVIWGSFAPLLELGSPQPGGYFDGFVIPVPHAARDEFKRFATLCDPFFTEHGAVWVMETWELEVPDGDLTDFRRAVAAKPDEAIVFSWVQWPNRTTRDAASARIMDDPRFAAQECPFDMTRMIYGGFVPVVHMPLDAG